MTRCPECGYSVIRAGREGGSQVATARAIVFAADGTAKAKCPGCKRWMPVPVRLGRQKAMLVAREGAAMAASAGSPFKQPPCGR